MATTTILTKAMITNLEALSTNMLGEDTSSLAVFSDARSLYAPYRKNKAALGKITKAYHEALTGHMLENGFKRRLDGVLKLAKEYVEHDVLTKYDHLRWYNLSAICKIAGHIAKDGDITDAMITELADLAKEWEGAKVPAVPTDGTNSQKALRVFREVLKQAWAKDMPVREYNDRVGDFLTAAKNTLKLTDVEGQFKRFKVSLASIINDLDINQLEEVQALLAGRVTEIKAMEAEEDAAKTA